MNNLAHDNESIAMASGPLPLKTNPFSAGNYSVALAETPDQVAAAQRLRYQTLFVEGGGTITDKMRETGRDQDQWDDVAYHVIVTDKRRDADNAVVGALRLTANFNLKPGQPFYTELAFDCTGLRNHYSRVLELSRFCVDPNGRGGSILLLIWRFTYQLLFENNFDVMIGCASFKGTDYEKHRPILSWLYHEKLSAPELMPVPVVDNHIKIPDILLHQADWDDAKKSVPTLLRGYLKFGARISDCAVIDPEFNTTFVAIYVDAKGMFASGGGDKTDDG